MTLFYKIEIKKSLNHLDTKYLDEKLTIKGITGAKPFKLWN